MRPIAAVFLCIVAQWGFGAHADEFRAAHAAFVAEIRDREPNAVIKQGVAVASERLWLWTEVRDDETPLKALLAKKALPLERRWYRHVPGGNPLADRHPDITRPVEEFREARIEASRPRRVGARFMRIARRAAVSPFRLETGRVNVTDS